MTGSKKKTKTAILPCPECLGTGSEYVGPFYSGPCLRCGGEGTIPRDVDPKPCADVERSEAGSVDVERAPGLRRVEKRLKPIASVKPKKKKKSR